MKDIFVKMDDISKILLEYIGSDDFNKAVQAIQNTDSNAFMGGIGMAGCLIMARCPKYITETEKEE